MQHKTSQQVLCDRLSKIISHYANHVAIKEHEAQYTYLQLSLLIEDTHQQLCRLAPEDRLPIGLLLGRGANAYACMWAALSLGRSYVPLNCDYPLSRLQNIIDQSGISIIISDDSTQHIAKNLESSYHLILNSPRTRQQSINRKSVNWQQSRRTDNPAYIMFTSGSTGNPKGVPISCENLLAFIDNLSQTVHYQQDDICSQICELSFDVSVQEIYLTLLNGCTLCPARKIDLFNPVRFITQNAISVWVCVPSMIRVIIENALPSEQSLHSIRLSLFNGEALTTSLLGKWRTHLKNCEIWNTYGPTECTVAVSTQLCSEDSILSEAGVVSIGSMLPNVEAALLHKGSLHRLGNLSSGTTGELLITSSQRFKGYCDSTIKQPFIFDEHGVCFYRTGDLVLWRDGKFFHLGRKDHQIKIGGHRIELLEIELRLRQLLNSDSLAVIAYPAENPKQLILVLENHIDPKPICKETSQLANYMIPRKTITVEKLPITSSGKLNRAALQELIASNAA